MTINRAKDPSQLSGPSVRDIRHFRIEDQYPVMVQNNRLRTRDLRRLYEETSAFGYRPLVSILMPVAGPHPNRLESTLDSVLAQIYPNWELCICCSDDAREQAEKTLSVYERLDRRIKTGRTKQDTGEAGLLDETSSLATGEFVGVLGCGDELAPEALFEVVKVLQERTDSDLIYSDEDTIDDEGVRSHPRFKPDWSPDLLLSTNYISHLGVYRRSLLEEAGGFREGFGDCQGYDLLLRFTERTDRILHIPKVLYHRRTANGSLPSESSNEDHTQAHQALSDALERRGLEGSVEDGLLPTNFRARLRIKDEPKVSLIIPSRDNLSLLKNCIESVERLTTYRNYEIIIMDNDSVDPETVKYLDSTPHRVIPFREPFNYSRINNAGVAQARGDYMLLLNDDTEVISGEWLEAMLEHAQRPEVGAVGAKLIYPDDRIQHAGILTGAGGAWTPGVATHSHQFYPSDSPGYLGAVASVTNYSAVTAACIMLRKSIFEEVGGFDEENLRVSFNDVDLCLRIRERGYSILYTPYAELYHHESVSRGYKGDPAEAQYMRDHWGEVLDNDPYYNPNFSRGGGDFSLRADLLRPRVLQEDIESKSEYSEGSSRNPLTASPEELKKFLMQHRIARDSSRTTIIPKHEHKSARIAALENLQHDEGFIPEERFQVTDSAPADARSTEEDKSSSIRAEQLIWMFGSPRTGSTWLSRIMAELDDQERWHEPYVGLLFGSFIYERLEGNEKLLNNPSFIMGERYRDVWLNSIKNFLIEGAQVRYPNLGKDQYLVVKEPNGSVGAPLLLEATPQSRLIFLIRDPRDVIASRLDAFKKGSWSAQQRELESPEKLDEFTKYLAEEYFKVVSQVQKAYETHPGKKVLVRYEDLRYDTVGTLENMYDALGIRYDEARLKAAVAKHSWEQIPDSDKGSGKFYRKARPGSWKEDLSPDQIKVIEDTTGPVLSRYY